MKKILIVSNMYPSKAYPHYGVFVKHCADILSVSGNSVDVVAMGRKKGKVRKLLSYVRFYFEVISAGIWGKYDVIYAHYASHTALPLLIVNCMNQKCPIVVNVHGNDIVPECEKEEKNRILSYKIMQKSCKIISPSLYFKNVLSQDYHISPRKIVVYPSGGVDMKSFCRIGKEKAGLHLSLDPSSRYIGYVSRIEEKKGWDLFLKACAPIVKRHPEVRLIVVGDGAQKPAFDALAETLQLSSEMIYRPLLSQTELVYIYNMLDLFVFPTYRKSESLGLVGLEAMACEDIVLAPDQYGPADYIRDGENGYQFATGNYLDMQEKIEAILAQDDQETVRRSARKTAEQYSNERTDHILIEVFQTLDA